MAEELEHALKSAAETRLKPLVIGFCCQYGLFGTGALGDLWRGTKAGVWIVPVLCIAKIEPDHMLRAFTMGAEGVFVAGCGDQCARENTATWVAQRVGKVQKALGQIGLEPERLQSFVPGATSGDPAKKLDEFVQRIGRLHLTSVLMQEVKR